MTNSKKNQNVGSPSNSSSSYQQIGSNFTQTPVPGSLSIKPNKTYTEEWDVGRFKDLKRNDKPFDGRHNHHVPPTHLMNKINPENGRGEQWAINMKEEIHRDFHRMRKMSDYNKENFVESLTNDSLALRKLGVPPDKNLEIIARNKIDNPGYFTERQVKVAQERVNQSSGTTQKVEVGQKTNQNYNFNNTNPYDNNSANSALNNSKPPPKTSTLNLTSNVISNISKQVGNLLKNDPSSIFTIDGLSSIVTGSIPGIATGVGIAYGVSKFIGNQVAKPIFVGIAVAEGGTCLRNYEGELYSNFSLQNASNALGYCIGDSLLTLTGGRYTMISSGIQGYMSKPDIVPVDNSNVSTMEKIGAGIAYVLYPVASAPGHLLNDTPKELTVWMIETNMRNMEGVANLASSVYNGVVDTGKSIANSASSALSSKTASCDSASADFAPTPNSDTFMDYVDNNSNSGYTQSRPVDSSNSNYSQSSPDNSNQSFPVTQNSNHDTNEITTQNTNKTPSQNTSKESTKSTEKDYVDFNYGTKDGAEKLENAAYGAISEIEENADKIKPNSKEEAILSWVNTTKEYLGIALELKGWKNLTEKQRTKLVTKVLVGELIKREAFAKAFELTSKEVSGVGFILNLATSAKIRVEQVAGQLYTLCSNGFPTGGIVNLITNLVKKTQKFSQVVSQAVQEIMTDMICYLNPTFAIAYGIYQAYNIVKELITTRKEIKIGPFSVMSSSRISINLTWKKILKPRLTTSHRHEIDFPLFDIHIVVHNKSKSEAEKQAVEQCKQQMEERCYTYIGIPYSLISGEELDVFKPPIDTKLPIYHTFIKSLWVMKLTSNWQDHHNLTEDQKRTFFLQMQESQEAKDLRLTHQVLGIKSSFFDENKNLNILEYISKFLITSDFSTRTTTLKAIYHLFFRTGHHKCQELKLSKPFKAFLSYFGVDVEDFLRYANYMKDMTEDELKEEVDKLKEKESKNFWDFVEEIKEKVKKEREGSIIKLHSNIRKDGGKGGLKAVLTPDDKKSLRDYELEEMEEIKNSSKEELDPHILIVEFLKYLGIDPSYVYGKERLQQIEQKYSNGGRYSRENVLFWLCNEQLGSVFSVGNLFETGVSTGVGMTCSTIAYIDHELPNMYRSPGNYVVSKSAQFSSNYCQNHICKELSKFVNNVIFDSLWRESKSDKFLKCLTTNIYSGISLGVSSVRSAVFDKQNNRSWLEFWYGVAENVVQNNITYIHEALVNQWTLWKECSNICLAYSEWLPKFLSVNYGKCYTVQLLASILGPAGFLESGPIVSGVMVMLTCRAIKSLIFKAGSLINKTFSGIWNFISSFGGNVKSMIQHFGGNNGGGVNVEENLRQENINLANQYRRLRRNRNRNFMENMVMADIHNELVEREVICSLSLNYNIEDSYLKPKKETVYVAKNTKVLQPHIKKLSSNYKSVKLDTSNRQDKLTSNIKPIILNVENETIKTVTKAKSVKVVSNYQSNKIQKLNGKKINKNLLSSKVKTNFRFSNIHKSCLSDNKLNDSEVKKLDDSKNIVEEKILQAEVIGDATPAFAEVVRNVVKSIPSVIVVDKAFESSLPIARPVSVY